MIPQRRLHRAVFIAAGFYNMAWGAWSILDPQWLFRVARMPPANYSAVFACLGMVVGIYGILYLDVARRLDRGWREPFSLLCSVLDVRTLENSGEIEILGLRTSENGSSRRGWTPRKDPGPYRHGLVDRDRHVAAIGVRAVRHERPDLVDSVRVVSPRQLADLWAARLTLPSGPALCGGAQHPHLCGRERELGVERLLNDRLRIRQPDELIEWNRRDH